MFCANSSHRTSQNDLDKDQAVNECKRKLGASFTKCFEATENVDEQTMPAVENPLEFGYFGSVRALETELARSPSVLDPSMSDMKATIVDQVFINPPGWSHLARGYMRHQM